MSLKKCPECNHGISEFAQFCPNCGYVLKDGKKFKEITRADVDDSTIGEGILTFILFHLGIIPMFIYLQSLKDRREKNSFYGYSRKKATITFMILAAIEITIIIIVFINLVRKYN